jgi:hypothetical protein
VNKEGNLSWHLILDRVDLKLDSSCSFFGVTLAAILVGKREDLTRHIPKGFSTAGNLTSLLTRAILHCNREFMVFPMV